METLSKIILTAQSACTVDNAATVRAGMFEAVTLSAEQHMAGFDASHNLEHVMRVVALSHYILAAERRRNAQPKLNPVIVMLAAILHDVTDKKYIKESSAEAKLMQILGMARVDKAIATAVVAVVNNVSYKTEMRDLEHSKSILEKHPELAIVQDADRLDAIGALGIGRTFTFGGAKMPFSDMQLTRDHITEKLQRLESMMKTDTGRKLAKERTRRINIFSNWWDEETSFVDKAVCS